VAVATMLNNGDFGFPYCATPAFSTPAVWCRVFQSRVFSAPAWELSAQRGLRQRDKTCSDSVQTQTMHDAKCDMQICMWDVLKWKYQSTRRHVTRATVRWKLDLASSISLDTQFCRTACDRLWTNHGEAS